MSSLPSETAYTEVERNFIDNSPPRLWPDSQNTVIGQVRRVYTDEVQALVDMLTMFWFEMAPMTSDDYLWRWERQVGLPLGPDKSLAERRDLVLGRLKYGAFTRYKRNKAIENSISVAFGQPIQLFPAGVSLVPEGVPIYAEGGSLTEMYRVYEDHQNFYYEVWVRSDIGATPSMEKNLLHVTPAGISFDIFSEANILDYGRAVRTKQPVAYFRMEDAAALPDFSGYDNDATSTGTLAASLIDTDVDDGDTASAFNGAQFASAPDQPHYLFRDVFSFEVWLSFPTGGSEQAIVGIEDRAYMRLNVDDEIELVAEATDTVLARSSSPLTVATTYHVVARKRGSSYGIFIDGVDATVLVADEAIADTASNGLFIARQPGASAQFFTGTLDEVAVYNKWLTAAQILDNYKTGVNDPT